MNHAAHLKRRRTMITPEVNTLVIVLPHGKPPFPPVACWGLILEKIGETSYKILIGENPNDITYSSSEQIIPFLHTDGQIKNPQRVFAENEEQIMLHLMMNFLKQQGVIPDKKVPIAMLPEPVAFVPIQKNTLVIVLPRGDNPAEACWGLVKGQLVGGNYEIQIGRFRHLKISSLVIQPDQLIPVYITDGSFSNPGQAVRQLRSQLFLHILLMFYSSEGSNFLRQLAGPLSTSDFILARRKRKPPPNPGEHT